MVSRRRMTTKRPLTRSQTSTKRAKSAPRRTVKAKRPVRKAPTRRAPRSRNLGGRAAAELAAFHNPFSKVVQQPRIPDGKATHSLGTRCQSVKDLKANDVGSWDLTKNTMHIFLFPGISSSVIAFNTPVNFQSASTQDRDFFVMGYKDHAPFFVSTDTDWFRISSQAAEEEATLRNTKKIAKWRLVSSGVKISLVNNDETNDGWFEAVRINNCMANEDFMLTTMNNSNVNSLGVVTPSINFAQQMENETSLVEESSYQTGLLKDIHKYTFNLHPTTDQIEFKTLHEEYNLRNNNPDDPVTNSVGQNDIIRTNVDYHNNKVALFDNGSQRAQNFVEKMVCRDHDMIYIRVHGRATNSETDVSSQLLLHATSNYEVMYDASNDLSKYQLKGENHPQMDKHIQAKKDEGSEAMNIL